MKLKHILQILIMTGILTVASVAMARPARPVPPKVIPPLTPWQIEKLAPKENRRPVYYASDILYASLPPLPPPAIWRYRPYYYGLGYYRPYPYGPFRPYGTSYRYPGGFRPYGGYGYRIPYRAGRYPIGPVPMFRPSGFRR